VLDKAEDSAKLLYRIVSYHTHTVSDCQMLRK